MNKKIQTPYYVLHALNLEMENICFINKDQNVCKTKLGWWKDQFSSMYKNGTVEFNTPVSDAIYYLAK